jgi:NAD(P)H-dependent FMN reductase
MNKPKIHIILGSVREGRAGEKVAKWFMNAMKDTESADLELVDVRAYDLPFLTDPVSPAYQQGAHPNANVQKWREKIGEADGYIFITPEYNHGVPGAFKNAVDHVYKEWNNKPIGFIGYGGIAGGSRSIEHWRQIAAELQMYDVREQVLIPIVWEAFDEQGNLKNSEIHAATANTILNRVATLATLLKPLRVK